MSVGKSWLATPATPGACSFVRCYSRAFLSFVGSLEVRKSVASLFVIRGRDQGTRFQLEESVHTVGRTQDNSVRLHDTEVSRSHAELIRQGDAYLLRDLSSSNGTFVNGQPTTRTRIGQRRSTAVRPLTGALHRFSRRRLRRHRRQSRHRPPRWQRRRRLADRRGAQPCRRQRVDVARRR